MPENRVPRPNCSDGFVTTDDRHARTAKDVCGRCGGTGMVEAGTGQTPEASFDAGAISPATAGDSDLREALKLAEGRLALLMSATLPESDHPSATEWVLRKVREALARTAPQVPADLTATVQVLPGGHTKCRLSFGDGIRFEQGRIAAMKAVEALAAEIAESDACPAGRDAPKAPVASAERGPYDPVRGRMAEGCCSACSPCSHQKRDPHSICETCQKAAALARPAAPAVDVVAANSEDPDDGWEWAVVEVMGHRRHAGRTREVERFGAKMIRVDVPTKGDPDAHGWTTHFYPGSALFSFTPCTREAALKANRPYDAPARLPYRVAEYDWAEDGIDG